MANIVIYDLKEMDSLHIDVQQALNYSNKELSEFIKSSILSFGSTENGKLLISKIANADIDALLASLAYNLESNKNNFDYIKLKDICQQFISGCGNVNNYTVNQLTFKSKAEDLKFSDLGIKEEEFLELADSQRNNFLQSPESTESSRNNNAAEEKPILQYAPNPNNNQDLNDKLKKKISKLIRSSNNPATYKISGIENGYAYINGKEVYFSFSGEDYVKYNAKKLAELNEDVKGSLLDSEFERYNEVNLEKVEGSASTSAAAAENSSVNSVSDKDYLRDSSIAIKVVDDCYDEVKNLEAKAKKVKKEKQAKALKNFFEAQDIYVVKNYGAFHAKLKFLPEDFFNNEDVKKCIKERFDNYLETRPENEKKSLIINSDKFDALNERNIKAINTLDGYFKFIDKSKKNLDEQEFVVSKLKTIMKLNELNKPIAQLQQKLEVLVQKIKKQPNKQPDKQLNIQELEKDRERITKLLEYYEKLGTEEEKLAKFRHQYHSHINAVKDNNNFKEYTGLDPNILNNHPIKQYVDKKLKKYSLGIEESNNAKSALPAKSSTIGTNQPRTGSAAAAAAAAAAATGANQQGTGSGAVVSNNIQPNNPRISVDQARRSSNVGQSRQASSALLATGISANQRNAGLVSAAEAAAAATGLNQQGTGSGAAVSNNIQPNNPRISVDQARRRTTPLSPSTSNEDLPPSYYEVSREEGNPPPYTEMASSNQVHGNSKGNEKGGKN